MNLNVEVFLSLRWSAPARHRPPEADSGEAGGSAVNLSHFLYETLRNRCNKYRILNSFFIKPAKERARNISFS